MSPSQINPLGITCGDPAGVGPEIALRAAASSAAGQVIYGDAHELSRRARSFGLSERFEAVTDLGAVPPGKVGLVHVGHWPPEALSEGPSAPGGTVQFACLNRAIDDALAGRIRGLVTGPMNKAAVNLAGIPFSGHTEHLAFRSGRSHDGVTMMFLGPRLRVALVTTHLSVRDVPDAITAPRVTRACLHMAQALTRLDAPEYSRGREVVVAGLNPHAGEGGLFGDEESTTLIPAIECARAHIEFPDGVQLTGPTPAETAIRVAASRKTSGVVAMMHDQATIPSKALDWGEAVNVTWGLPFVRTSVDHGVGYEAVEAGVVDASGMCAALRMAQRLTR